MEYADDAGLADTDTITASRRITHLDEKVNAQSGMCISVPKTKVQHIQHRPKVSATSEQDINDLPPELAFKFKCEACDRLFPNVCTNTASPYERADGVEAGEKVSNQAGKEL